MDVRKYLQAFLFCMFSFSASALPELVMGVTRVPEAKLPKDLYFLEDYETYRVVYSPLFSRDTEDNAKPFIGSSWTTEENPATLSIKINPKSRFSDGSNLSAVDVVWTFQDIIARDTKKKMILSRCVDSKGLNGISSTLEGTVKISLGNCTSSRLIEELSSPDYGILKKPKDLNESRNPLKGPFSGPFKMVSSDSEKMILEPNNFHWIWENIPTDKRMRLKISKIDFDKIAKDKSELQNFDFFKTNDMDVKSLALNSGFTARISPPIMTWFLAPLKDTSEFQKSESMLAINALKEKILGLKFKIFESPSLQKKAISFFPEDFNCDANLWQSAKLNKTFPVKYSKIAVLRHPTLEDSVFITDLKVNFQQWGISLLVFDKKSDIPTDIPAFSLYRQFLGPDFLTTFQLSFLTFKHIPDPTKQVEKLINHLDESPKDKQRPTISAICKLLPAQPFVPIAHRQVAFLTKRKEFEKLFSRSSGYMTYFNLPELAAQSK
jgi:hypothetical protein